MLQYDVKAKYRLISGKFSGMKFFSSSLSQAKATRLCIRSINRSNCPLFPLFVVSVLFARFHVKVIRKSLYLRVTYNLADTVHKGGVVAEHSTSTNLSQGFKSWCRRHMWVRVCWWFSPLLWDVFLRLLRFSPFLKNPAFPNSNFTRNKIDEEPLRGCATSKMVIKSLLLEPELSIFSCFYFRLHDEIHFFHRPKWIWPGMNICCMTLKGNGANFVELPSFLHNF